MSEEEFFERAINRICKDYDYNFANELKNIYLKKDKKLQQKDKEIERLKNREQECIDHYLVQCKYASEMEDKYIIANNIINKAIDFLKENACIDEDVEYFCDDLRYDDCKKLLDILRGSDKE